MTVHTCFCTFSTPVMFILQDNLQYMSGFGNEFTSEDPRCPGALPHGQVCLKGFSIGTTNLWK